MIEQRLIQHPSWSSRPSVRPVGRPRPAPHAAANRDVVLVGFDFCCGAEEALTAGIEDATGAPFPSKMADLGVDSRVKAIRGESVPSLVGAGAALVTEDNMARFK